MQYAVLYCAVYYIVVQYTAGFLQYAAGFVLQYTAVCCAVYCSVLYNILHRVVKYMGVLCNTLQHVVQYIAVCWTV